MPYLTSYGFDPSLQHGALVQVVTQSNPVQIRRLDQIYTWNRGSDLALSEGSSVEAVYALAQDILKKVRPGSARVMAIDYDPRTVYWTRRPMQVALLNLFLGYFIRGVHERGIPVILIAPDAVRKFFKLRNKQPKLDVHRAFTSSVPLPAHFLATKQHEDTIDAAILAYIASKSSLENTDARVTSSYLLGSRTPTGAPDQEVDETDSTGRIG